MNGKERITDCLNRKQQFPPPVTIHAWGVYKFQFAGVINGPADEERGWALRGQDLAAVDSCFYEAFRPDCLHLSSGAWNPQPGDGERHRAAAALRPAVMELDSKRVIDEYVAAVTPSEEEIRVSGVYSHVPLLAERYGAESLILLNEGNPVCGVFENGGPAGDFEDALVATIRHPENLAYLLWKLYDAILPRMRVLKASGADGYIGSETTISADILSPKTFRSLIFPALQHFYTEIEKFGLLPVTYFLGDVNPLLDDIARMGVRGLMVEESKKAFLLDVVDIRKRLDPRVALFGNVDSIYHLRLGTQADVLAETRRQCLAARYGPFILTCGSPLPYDTPVSNIHAMVNTARAVLAANG